VDGHAARLFADRDFGDLVADIVAVCILYSDDRDLFASRLTTTRRVSSEVRAMVVDRLGAASAFFDAVRAKRTAIIATISAVLPQDAIFRRSDLGICELFMYRPPRRYQKTARILKHGLSQGMLTFASVFRNWGIPCRCVREIPDES
jgi:hypothetical protein